MTAEEIAEVIKRLLSDEQEEKEVCLSSLGLREGREGGEGRKRGEWITSRFFFLLLPNPL